MAVITSQQINNYYSLYLDKDVTFTKEISRSLGVVSNQIFLRFKNDQRPCVLYSSSLQSARVIVALDEEVLKNIQDNQNNVSLRFSFKNLDYPEAINFFVQSKISGLNLYNKERQLYFANLVYTQRPPDDLILILGRLLEASSNAEKRGEERIILNVDNLRKMGLSSKNAQVLVERVPRNVIIRDLSFGGAKVIILGNAKFLMGKEMIIILKPLSGIPIKLVGKIVRFEVVEGRKDIAALAVHYDPDKIPLEYKMMISNYLQKI